MKKSKTDNSSVLDAHRQNFVGKVLSLTRCQVVVEDVIAEGLLVSCGLIMHMHCIHCTCSCWSEYYNDV